MLSRRADFCLLSLNSEHCFIDHTLILGSLKQELDDTIAKHELLEEEYVVAKAKLQMERDEMKADYDAMQVQGHSQIIKEMLLPVILFVPEYCGKVW